MIIDLDGQTLDTDCERRFLWYSPTLENPFHLESQIVVQM